MERVMDLPGWPPNPGGSVSGGGTFPIAIDLAVIEEVIQVMKDHVTFTCRSNGDVAPYRFQMPDTRTGEKIAKILNDNRGRSLLSIGIIEIPTD